ncbi:MAG: hypothetical protein LBH85_02880 [Treponema sp.]|nr:hypothetical protein [Treponema sp.]
MKRLILSFVLAVSMSGYLSAFGFLMEGGLGYNNDEKVGLGFVASSKGTYFGVGAGMIFGDEYSE